MFTRRSLAALAAGAAVLPALPKLAHAVEAAPRRSTDADVAMPASGARPWKAQIPVLRVGLIGGENETDRLARYDGYAKLLQTTFDVPVKLYPASDYAGVLQGLSAAQLEMAELGAAGYAGAWLDTNGGIEALLAPEESDGSISYVSVIVVRADSKIHSIEDLKGHSLAWADPNSTSGFLIPRFALRQAGINPESGAYFSKTGFAGGHEQGVVAVLHNQYDAACTWASGVGDASTGYTRGNLRAMIDKGMLKMSDLRIIWKSGPIPNGPLAVRTALPASFKEDMTNFHLALPKAHRDIYDQIERGGGTGFRSVTNADYKLIIDLRREEANDRRRRA